MLLLLLKLLLVLMLLMLLLRSLLLPVVACCCMLLRSAAAAAAAWMVQLQMLLSLVGVSVILESSWVGVSGFFRKTVGRSASFWSFGDSCS